MARSKAAGGGDGLHGPMSRRRLIGAGALIVPAVVLGGVSLRPGRARAATPACDDGDAPTPAQTAGPYFTPGSPLKADFTGDAAGEGAMIQVRGQVLDRACRPVGGALLDIWHAAPDGRYDNRGFRMRGHQFTDEHGRYALATLRPGLYPGRTRHIHLRAQAPGGPVLTTQLYFPGEPGNDRDFLYRDALLMAGDGADGFRFDLVIAVAAG